MGLALGTAFKFYTSLAKGLKLKVKRFLGIKFTFVEVAGEKLVGGGGSLSPPPLYWIGLTVALDFPLNEVSFQFDLDFTQYRAQHQF